MINFEISPKVKRELMHLLNCVSLVLALILSQSVLSCIFFDHETLTNLKNMRGFWFINTTTYLIGIAYGRFEILGRK